jgi:hypothetical protein
VRRVREQLLDAGEKVAGALIDVAAEAVEVGVRGALGTVLGRASQAASRATDALREAKRKIDGRDE